MSSSRRKFLTDSVKSLSLLGISHVMANSIIQTLSSTAVAATDALANASDKIYLFFNSPGAPPQWLFSLPLAPNGIDAKFDKKTALGTYIGVDAGVPEVEYKVWKDPVSGLYLPPVWGSNPSGGSFANCLANSVFIRGVDMEINNHNLGRLRNQAPNIGGLSIAGQYCEKTKSPLPSVVSGSIKDAFKSKNSIAPVEADYRVTANVNPISNLLKYFKTKAQVMNLGVQQVQDELDSYAKENGFYQANLIESKERADELIKKGVGQFSDLWQPTYLKYEKLVSDAFNLESNTLLLLSKGAIPLEKAKEKVFDDNMTVGIADLRNMVDADTTIANLAETFAMIEILTVSKLTQVVTVDLQNVRGLNVTATSKSALTHDHHNVGQLVSTFVTTFYYRSILSCLESLVETLKSNRLFEKTIIHYGTEFNRSPRVTGIGSDHGVGGSSALLISGMIDGTSVVGNTKADASANYKGTWGLAANHPLASNAYPLRANDIARTVCSMLGIANVSNNGVNILTLSAGKWKKYAGTKGEAKNG